MSKIVVVTGANKGLGLQIVRTLVAAEFCVIATCRSMSDELSKLTGDSCEVVEFDFENTDEVHELSRNLQSVASEKFGGAVYGLVNNLAIFKNHLCCTFISIYKPSNT